MHAVKNEAVPVYFGGSYRELWSENYRLSVEYSGRRLVGAKYDGERWRASGGDAGLTELLDSPGCPINVRRYFEAAAEVYAAVRACQRQGLPLTQLRECFYAMDNPF
ncbi:MAG: hypothetical protein ACOX68_01885, partial [Candidatus Limivicinus sp.]